MRINMLSREQLIDYCRKAELENIKLRKLILEIKNVITKIYNDSRENSLRSIRRTLK